MEKTGYTTDEKALLIGRALALADKGHRPEVGKLMDRHPEIFNGVISSILAGDIAYNYEIRNLILKLAKDLGYREEFLID